MDAMKLARREFDRLAEVNNDPLAQTQIADLVWAAQFELDLEEEGEVEYTPSQRRRLQAFVDKWRGK